MRLRSFSIRNYKSIIDSGKCYFDADMVVLAGKNEAGKTATLEALRDFDPEIGAFPESATPIGHRDAVPSLRLVFDVTRPALRDVKDEADVTWGQETENYVIDEGLSLMKTQRGEKCVYSIGDDVKAVARKSGCVLGEDEEVRLVKEILKRIPRFVFFGDFSTKLPPTISLNSAASNPTVVAFLEEAGLDLDQLKATSGDPRARRIILMRAAEKINKALEEYIEGVKLVPDAEGDELVFWIEDLQNRPFKLSERSKGFQWLLSCYLDLCAIHDQVVLIDEPALYLHPKAQATVLKLLGKATERHIQIIYSTHSPFLIDPIKLERVKLVVRNDCGTKIKKFHDTTDPDTLTPIVKAIGLDLGAVLSPTNKYNVVVEGISDYYYLKALRLLVDNSELIEFWIIPCTGANVITQLISVLCGWDLHFVVVLDNDDKGDELTKSVRAFRLDDGQIIRVPNAKPKSSIEDMFSRDEFNEYVLSARNLRNDDPDVKNSEFLKRPPKDKREKKDKYQKQSQGQKEDLSGFKVDLALSLYQAAKSHPENIKFSRETLDSFSTLFSKISSYFRSH